MNNIKILKKLIKVLKEEGIEMKSPYDFENFIHDNTNHSNLFATKEFPCCECGNDLDSIARSEENSDNLCSDCKIKLGVK